jgi:DNA-binding transcriptional ArsR family regulator
MNTSSSRVLNIASQESVGLLDSGKFARICKALGHPARVKIVEFLLSADRCICGEIVNILPLAQSTVSQHLKSLRTAGLIQGDVEGPRTCYCLDMGVLAKFRNTVAALNNTID